MNRSFPQQRVDVPGLGSSREAVRAPCPVTRAPGQAGGSGSLVVLSPARGHAAERKDARAPWSVCVCVASRCGPVASRKTLSAHACTLSCVSAFLKLLVGPVCAGRPRAWSEGTWLSSEKGEEKGAGRDLRPRAGWGGRWWPVPRPRGESALPARVRDEGPWGSASRSPEREGPRAERENSPRLAAGEQVRVGEGKGCPAVPLVSGGCRGPRDSEGAENKFF